MTERNSEDVQSLSTKDRIILIGATAGVAIAATGSAVTLGGVIAEHEEVAEFTVPTMLIGTAVYFFSALSYYLGEINRTKKF